MKKRGWATALFALFGFLLLLPQPSTAAVVWSEDFSGGLGEWSIGYGNWEVVDGYLRHDGSMEPYLADITHNSSQTIGTWSFDAKLHTSMEGFRATYLFMVNGTTDDYYGYGIRLAVTAVHLVRQSGGDGSAVSLGFAIVEDLGGNWVHIDVTRDIQGKICVFIDAQSDIVDANITSMDQTYTESEYFAVHSYSAYAASLDNVVVDDEILISEPETTSTSETTSDATSETVSTSDDTSSTDGTSGSAPDLTLVLAGAGVGVVVLVVAIVFVKRR